MNDQPYPSYWPALAIFIKKQANFRCQDCGHPHSPKTGHALTVHHKDGDKTNSARSNLIALCQRCHLRREARLRLYGPEDERQMRLPMEC